MLKAPWDEEFWGNPFSEIEKQFDLQPGDLVVTKDYVYHFSDPTGSITSNGWNAVSIPSDAVMFFVGYDVWDSYHFRNTGLEWPAMVFLYNESLYYWVADNLSVVDKTNPRKNLEIFTDSFEIISQD